VEPGEYRERTVASGVVLWASGGGPTTVLPDGCLDLVWDGAGLRIAGPDTAARHLAAAGPHVGLRFSHGLGPGAVGVPADAVRDATVDLDAVWSSRAARVLSERVADDPAAALEAWLHAARPAPAPFGARVFAAAAAGVDVATIAARCGVAPRTLHRRCLPVFGYGPQHLGRVLRLQRALARARAGTPWADVAACEGYADQPHLAREVRALAGTTPTRILGGVGTVVA
jgi:AraC-like DNA-binding protein